MMLKSWRIAKKKSYQLLEITYLITNWKKLQKSNPNSLQKNFIKNIWSILKICLFQTILLLVYKKENSLRWQKSSVAQFLIFLQEEMCSLLQKLAVEKHCPIWFLWLKDCTYKSGHLWTESELLSCYLLENWQHKYSKFTILLQSITIFQ